MAEQVHVHNPFYRAKWMAAGFDRPPTLDDLRDLPFTTKDELAADQEVTTFALGHQPHLSRSIATSGSTALREPPANPSAGSTRRRAGSGSSTAGSRSMRAPASAPADRVFTAFGFGPFIGFWTAFEAAQQLGCLVMPGGHLSTEQRLRRHAR